MNTRKRTFIMLNLILTCIASSFLQTALTTALPPMIQDLHISVSEGQWLTSGYSLAMEIMMPLTAFLITRCPTKKLYVSAIGMKKLAVTGTCMMMLSTLGMSLITADTSVIVAAFLNVIRSVAIGCLMMPFVTFGISSMGAENTAHGTALLTSLRTIAGAIGTAVFVGILNVCEAGKAAASYPNPGIYGLHVTFACMTVATVIMLAIISIGMRKRSRV